MFKRVIPLNAAEHQSLRIKLIPNWSFALSQTVFPIAMHEIGELARAFPIVFLKGQSLPFVLCGLQKGVNAYVGPDGRWLAPCIPSVLGMYPLSMSRIQGRDDEMVVVLDPDAPHLSDFQGSALFENGQPSEWLNQRISLLKQRLQSEARAKQATQAIVAAGLLADLSIRFSDTDPGEGGLSGLQMVDEKRLQSLFEHDLFALHQKGALALIYAHLVSLGNLRQRPLAVQRTHSAGDSPGGAWADSLKGLDLGFSV